MGLEGSSLNDNTPRTPFLADSPAKTADGDIEKRDAGESEARRQRVVAKIQKSEFPGSPIYSGGNRESAGRPDISRLAGRSPPELQPRLAD